MGSNHRIDLNRSASLANLSLHQLGYVSKIYVSKIYVSNFVLAEAEGLEPSSHFTDHMFSGHADYQLSHTSWSPVYLFNIFGTRYDRNQRPREETCRDDKIRTCARFTHAPHPKCGEVDQLLHIPFLNLAFLRPPIVRTSCLA